MRSAPITALAAAALGVILAPAARAEGELRICLEESTPPYSFKHGEHMGGFDLAVAEALAKKLGRTLSVQWFETDRDVDSNPPLQENALLSDGRCQLVGGYPLYTESLRNGGAEKARLPDFAGNKPGDRRRWVKIGELKPTRAYHFAPLTVVLGPTAGERHIEGLKDLVGVKLGIDSGSFADAVLMAYGDGKLVNDMTHLVPGRDQLFERLEKGEFDATLVELQRFDVYRNDHPDTKLKLSGYYHRFGVNMGLVGLSTETELIAAVDKALGEMLDKGELPPLAQAAGMTYLPPRQPDVRENFTPRDFYKE